METHWINWLINTPSECKGRLKQVVAGCWLNASFNVLLFTPSIKDKMIEKMIAYANSKKILNEEFPICHEKIRDSPNNTLDDIIFSIIWFVKNDKTKSVVDYMIVLAAKIKGVIMSKYDIGTLNKIIPDYSIIKDIIDGENLYKICRANDTNKIRKKVCDLNNNDPQNVNALNELNKLCYYTYPGINNTICADNFTEYAADYALGYTFGYAEWPKYAIHSIIRSVFKNSVYEY